jgi:hypothetical protein
MADDQTDSDTTQTDDVNAGGDDTGAEEEKPLTKEEADKLKRAASKAAAGEKTAREKYRELLAKTEGDTEKAAREQAEAAEKKYKPIAIRAAAKAAFLEAGLQGGSPELIGRLVRSLDLDAISVDDDGDVVGLDEQVAALKAEAPQLFEAKDKKLPRVTVGDRPGRNGRSMSASERQAAAVLGR